MDNCNIESGGIDLATPIGDRLRQQREARRMTQTQLARDVGVQQSTISAIERGISKSANAVNLLKLCAILETNPQWLLTGKGDPELSSYAPDDSEILMLSAKLPPNVKAAWVAAGLAMLKPHNK